jgi:hydroxyacylglutathione hydrolase
MMSSLGRLAALPDDTRVYCGHEYTQKNLEFAVSLEPGNQAATKKLADVRTSGAGKPRFFSTIAEEGRAVTPDRRLSWRRQSRVRHSCERCGALFAAVRALKDRF